MVFRQALLWPEHFDMRLWSFEMDQVEYFYNHLPNKHSLLLPLDIFTGSKIDPSTSRNKKVWGFPANVLDPKLQYGKNMPKWDPRTRQGQCLGKSMAHSISVGLIKNLRTRNMSPQFHVVHDNLFLIVMGAYQENDDLTEHM